MHEFLCEKESTKYGYYMYMYYTNSMFNVNGFKNSQTSRGRANKFASYKLDASNESITHTQITKTSFFFSSLIFFFVK